MLAEEAVQELKIDDGEFHVCTGFVNNAVADYLQTCGFKVVRMKIEGKTQMLVEKAYENYVQRITGLQKLPPSGKRFFTLLNWVRKDVERRECYVKTGWKSWNARWRTPETQKS